MSSMRNAVQRRNHKERAQPAQREKWGILEKHKDYSLRAKDYNEKKKRLKILREKAAERNPDEFSYGMLSSKTDRYGRRIQDRGNQSLSQDAVKLLKTQDAGYLKTMIQQTRRAREKVEQGYLLQNIDGVQTLKREEKAKSGQHVIFAGNQEEQQSLKRGNSGGVMPSREDVTNPRLEEADAPPTTLDARGTDHIDPQQAKRLKDAELLALKKARRVRKQRKRIEESRQSKLNALKIRERDLLAAEQELGDQRARMNNSIGGVNKNGVRWKVRERKR
ncbi:MAG: hypothetical protein Q9183_002399 [Haloplaca sp. 2 TL-2023]